MAERNLSPEVINLIKAGKVEPAIFLFLDFPSAPVRMWSGMGNYIQDDSNGTVWYGTNSVVAIEQIQEVTDLGVPGIKVTLNGLDETLVQKILAEPWQRRRMEMLIGFWDKSIQPPEIMFPPEPLWMGTMDTDNSTISGRTTSLSIACEHRMVDILRKREVRLTDRDQQYLHSTGDSSFVDTAFTRIEQIQDLKVPWGRTQT